MLLRHGFLLFLLAGVLAALSAQPQTAAFDFRENEHQELFYLGVNLNKPVTVHIPSPLGFLKNYIFVRVPAETAEKLTDITGTLGGQGIRAVDNMPVVPSTAPGMAWRCLGAAPAQRGNFPLTLNGWPAEVDKVDLLVCTWPRFVQSGMADQWIADQADPLWAPTGVPLGGIGGGRIDICKDGRFRNFSMNNNQDSPVENPDGMSGMYLAITQGNMTKDLASRSIVAGHQACPKLEYSPRFPQAVLRAPDAFPDIDVTATLSGTLIPQDLKRSCVPGFLVRWTVENHGKRAAKIRCRLGWPNLVGVGGGIAGWESNIGYGDGFYHYWNDPTGRAITPIKGTDFAALRYTGTPADKYLASAGEHLLGVANGKGMQTGTTVDGENGEVYADLTVPAGKRMEATMAVVAAMPHWVDSLGKDRGAFWQNHYADGTAMLSTLLDGADGWLRDAGALATLLDDSTLPGWLKARLSNCNYPLVVNSVFYRDGRFSVNEGPTEMAGCYGTMDQRLSGHPATQLLFPALNATELKLFAALQGPKGTIPHDLGSGHLEAPPRDHSWPDLCSSFVLQCARHAWSTGDTEFANALWPTVRKVLLAQAAWAQQGNGVPQVGTELRLGTSYDCYHYQGTTGYIGTLWLATLNTCEAWAAQVNDAELLEKIPQWRAAALQRLDEDIWNGRYFVTCGTKTSRRDTVHAGQLAGQVFSRMLCGKDVLPPEKVRSCVDALLAINGSTVNVIPPDEAAPDGKAMTLYGWLPYVEGYMLTAVASEGDARLWPLWERMIRCVNDDDRHPCDTRLMYRPGGELNWGTNYMTAPASWQVYDMWTDFSYTPANGALRLRASIPGRYPLVHPRFWAVAEVKDGGAVTLTIRKVFGTTPCAIQQIEVPLTATGVAIDGQLLAAGDVHGNYRQYRLPKSWTLREGATLNWIVKP